MKRFFLWVRKAALRYEISSAEQWVRACERDGIFDSYSVREVSKQIDVCRVKLAILEAS